MLACANSSFQNFYQQNSQESLSKMINSNTAFLNSNNIYNTKLKNDINVIPNQKLHQKTACSQLRTTTLLYRSEFIKYSSARIAWRSFTLQSTEINGK